MKLGIGFHSDRGRVRANNQDAFSVDLLDPRENAALLMVADGMGGYEGGEIASRLAVQAVRARVLEQAADWAEKGRLAEGLIEAIGQANQSILQEQLKQPHLNSMGTTLTAALIWGERILIGHIGDSKAFLIGKEQARQLTTDHNLAAELLQSGHLTPDQAALHPQRHVLTRALGIGESVAIEQLDTPWQNGDLLVLSTDGLSNLVSMVEIQSSVTEVEFASLAARLVDLANARGGYDNITVLIARWEG